MAEALAVLARAGPNATWRRIWLLWNEPGAGRSHVTWWGNALEVAREVENDGSG